MRDLPLAAEHARLGATFGDVAGWRVPLDYGDVASERRAVRGGAGVLDWTPHGKVRVTGEDRLEFLDNLVTNDVKALAEGRGLYAATLDHKGRVHGDMAVYHAGDHYLLETEPEALEPALARFRKLLVSEDVSLEDATDAFVVLGVFGPQSPDLLTPLLGAVPTGAYDHRHVEWEGAPGRVARSPYFLGEGFGVWLPPGPGAASLLRALTEGGAAPVGARAAEALRIETGRPKYGVDMGEDTLALEARLEPAISMTKGCYVGQEVVSRVTRLGRLHRLLVALEIDGEPPARGASVLAQGETVGTVTSAAPSAVRGRAVALGYVRTGHAEPGTAVSVGGSAARVASLPWADPDALRPLGNSF